jgi:hypothetical protein
VAPLQADCAAPCDGQECSKSANANFNIPMKNGVFWDVAPCGSCKNLRFGGRKHLHHQGDKNRCIRNNVRRNRSGRRLQLTANNVLTSPIIVTLIMVAPITYETSVLQEPHDVTSQKTLFFIVTHVKNSNHTMLQDVCKMLQRLVHANEQSVSISH